MKKFELLKFNEKTSINNNNNISENIRDRVQITLHGACDDCGCAYNECECN